MNARAPLMPALRGVHRARRALALACPLAAAAGASTPQAWAEHEARLVAACRSASTLQDARPLGRTAVFDDAVGVGARLFTGRVRAADGTARTVRVLCLYDRRTGTAHVAPADELVSGRMR